MPARINYLFTENKANVYTNRNTLFVYGMTFGEWLRLKIKEKGFSNAELARRVGVSATYIGNLVRDYSPNTKSGKSRPSEALVEKLSKVFEIDIDEARNAAGYSSENKSIPEEIAAIPYDRFQEKDIEEIVNFIKFKLLGTVEEKTTGDVLKLFYRDLSLTHRQGTHEDFFGKNSKESIKPEEIKLKKKVG